MVLFRVVLIALSVGGLCSGQPTQGLLSGEVWDSVSALPLAHAVISAIPEEGAPQAAVTNNDGQFVFRPLSPGSYTLRATLAGYHGVERTEVRLEVGGALRLSIRMRMVQYAFDEDLLRSAFPLGDRGWVTTAGTDIRVDRSQPDSADKYRQETFETALSEVISARLLRAVPLAGRDAYSLTLLLPGVTADTATGRGLGISTFGLRPSSSSFLLDGVENDDRLLAGPAVGLPPESFAEYRISTGNFSAEFGNSAGMVANGVTYSPTSAWHGIAYLYGTNEAFNAGDFGMVRGRTIQREWNPGAQAGGFLNPRLYVSASFDLFRGRSQTPPSAADSYLWPTVQFLDDYKNQPGGRLLLPFRDLLPKVDDYTAPMLTPRPGVLNHSSATTALEYGSNSGFRIALRPIFQRLEKPDFVWSPYPGYSSTLWRTNAGGTIAASKGIGAWWFDARAGWTGDRLEWNRPDPALPSFNVLDNGAGVVLPGSPAAYSFRYRNQAGQLLATAARQIGVHYLKFGADILRRRLSTALPYGEQGVIRVSNLFDFGTAGPGALVQFYRDRTGRMGGLREYDQFQWAGFVQDNWRLGRNASLAAGVRYEYFGTPTPTSRSIPDSFAGSTGAVTIGPGRPLREPDRNNFATRVGLSVSLPFDISLRTAYGTFYDRPFDELFAAQRNNNLESFSFPASGAEYRDLAILKSTAPQSVSLPLFRVEPGLRDPLVHQYFAGLQRRIGDALTLELNGLGSASHNLLTSDLLRGGDRLVTYRANQGESSFHALNAVVRWRSSQLELVSSYSWSHAIDFQSELLTGDAFGLDYRTSSDRPAIYSAFSREGDPRGDKGSADFDQRHAWSMLAVWTPRIRGRAFVRTLAGNWQFAGVSGARSGFPYTVLAGLASGSLVSRRADLLDPIAARTNQPAGEGRRLLSAAAFAAPAFGVQGNTGRNAFAGPGLYSVDVSAARTFVYRERWRNTLRLDAFNLLNHANLGPPNPRLGEQSFGLAGFGRTGWPSVFPALTPLAETARRLQLSLRLEF